MFPDMGGAIEIRIHKESSKYTKEGHIEIHLELDDKPLWAAAV